MNFASFAFLLLFSLAIGLRLLVGRQGRETPYLLALCLASLLFYSWHVPAYLWILLASSTVDYLVGRRLGRLISTGAGTRRSRLLLLWLSVVTNLGLLGVFKYADFFTEAAQDLGGLFGLESAAGERLGLVLPMGISFYTFQSMSYTIDIYRGQLTPLRSFWRFLLFVAFFPQLVAGPIVRAREFIYQLNRRRRIRLRVVSQGAYLIVRGFFLKLVLADNLAPLVDRSWADLQSGHTSSATCWLVVFLFSCQIFCDFAGYSSIARGVAYVLGFRLPINFRSPYIAASFGEFWTRWHVTLSRWLRDYLYIPLGGNRGSRTRTYVNLMLVMLIGGLWHGAAWNFVLWGALHGGALAVERALGLQRGAADRSWLVRGAWLLVVQIVVLLAWVCFRSSSLGECVDICVNMLTFHGGDPGDLAVLGGLGFAAPVILMHLRAWFEERGTLPPADVRDKALWSGIMLYLTLTCYGRSSAFIYFQF